MINPTFAFLAVAVIFGGGAIVASGGLAFALAGIALACVVAAWAGPL